MEGCAVSKPPLEHRSVIHRLCNSEKAAKSKRTADVGTGSRVVSWVCSCRLAQCGEIHWLGRIFAYFSREKVHT